MKKDHLAASLALDCDFDACVFLRPTQSSCLVGAQASDIALRGRECVGWGDEFTSDTDYYVGIRLGPLKSIAVKVSQPH